MLHHTRDFIPKSLSHFALVVHFALQYYMAHDNAVTRRRTPSRSFHCSCEGISSAGMINRSLMVHTRCYKTPGHTTSACSKAP
jgi:hypothetical protein